MMGADNYQTESEIASLLAEGKIPIGIGRNTKIRYYSTAAQISRTIDNLCAILRP